MKKYIATSLVVVLVAALSFAAGVWYGEGDTIYVQDDSLLTWNDGWLTIQSEIPEGVVFKTQGTYADSEGDTTYVIPISRDTTVKEYNAWPLVVTPA